MLRYGAERLDLLPFEGLPVFLDVRCAALSKESNIRRSGDRKTSADRGLGRRRPAVSRAAAGRT
jgi:hypothetical protein